MPASKKTRQHNPETSRRATPRSRGRTVAKIVVGLVALAFISGIAVFLFVMLGSGGSDGGPRTAAIVDQLGLTQPNPEFAQTATKILEDAGYTVDYYPGDAVTVDFYRDLPTHGYDLIILRVHSGLARDRGEPTGYVSLFTGEPFSETKYVKEKEAGLVGRATYFDGSPQVFGIVPEFIKTMMKGRFGGATILMLGCDGLVTDATADAFVKKGAKVVVGWNGRVSQKHTDAAGEHLLRHLLDEGLNAENAVARTMTELGPDPDFESVLSLYPREGG